MTLQFKATLRFEKSFKHLPEAVQRKFYKQLDFLLSNMMYPSLQCKKIQGAEGIWEARVDYKYRFTFTVQSDVLIFRVIGNHDEVLNNP